MYPKFSVGIRRRMGVRDDVVTSGRMQECRRSTEALTRKKRGVDEKNEQTPTTASDNEPQTNLTKVIRDANSTLTVWYPSELLDRNDTRSTTLLCRLFCMLRVLAVFGLNATLIFPLIIIIIIIIITLSVNQLIDNASIYDVASHVASRKHIATEALGQLSPSKVC